MAVAKPPSRALLVMLPVCVTCLGLLFLLRAPETTQAATSTFGGDHVPTAQHEEAKARIAELEAQLAALQEGAEKAAPKAEAAAAADDGLTHHECHVFGAWTDMCKYENVCFSEFGRMVVLVKEGNLPSRTTQPVGSYSMKMSTKLPNREVDPNRYYPVHYHGKDVSFMTRAQLEKEDVVWTAASDMPGNKATYLVSQQDSLANIWYYSTRVLPLWTAQAYQAELDLPDIGEIVMPLESTKISTDWHTGMLDIILGDKRNDTKVYYGETAPYYGMSGKGKLVCAKKAVLMGANVFGFSDMVTAHSFKRAAYEYAGLTAPPIQPDRDTEYSVPENVTVLDRRKDQGRHITNVPDTLAVIEKYGFKPNYVVLSSKDTFKDQIRLMASTGVLISVHGAGLMNQIFMPPGASTIEMFPRHAKHTLYERIAHYSGIYHFKLYAEQHPRGMQEFHPDYFTKGCENKLSMDIPGSRSCWIIVKNVVMLVPLRTFEVAFVNAVDFWKRTMLLPDLPEAT